MLVFRQKLLEKFAKFLEPNHKSIVMSEVNKRIISLYAEATPNPETMKFVVNVMLFDRDRIDMPDKEAAEKFSPLAVALFEQFDFVRGVFIANNFVTITKEPSVEWIEIISEVREYIKAYVQEEKPVLHAEVIKEHKEKIMNADPSDHGAIEAKIIELLNKYVQPAVEMDGGHIAFKSFDKGIVTLGMQGSCAGCPSSTVTLKSGIENLLKRMVPEVQEVVAEDVV